MAAIIYWIAMTGVTILVLTAMAVKNTNFNKKYDNWYSIALVILLLIAIISGNIYNN